MTKIKLKRLNIEVPLDVHCDIKKYASSRNMTLTAYVSLVLYEQALREHEYENINRTIQS